MSLRCSVGFSSSRRSGPTTASLRHGISFGQVARGRAVEHEITQVARMKKLDPDFYSETLAPDTDDGRNIDALLSRAEDSYGAWRAELKRAGKIEKDPEHDLWQEYLKEKKLMAN